jgi:hypothetical protein
MAAAASPAQTACIDNDAGRRAMATMFSRFTKAASRPAEAIAESEPVDVEDEIRSLYDSSWALSQGLLVIESFPPEFLPDEWGMFHSCFPSVSPA